MTPRSTPARTSSRTPWTTRSEEHTSELQSQSNLVCRLLLEKKKYHYTHVTIYIYLSIYSQMFLPIECIHLIIQTFCHSATIGMSVGEVMVVLELYGAFVDE